MRKYEYTLALFEIQIVIYLMYLNLFNINVFKSIYIIM